MFSSLYREEKISKCLMMMILQFLPAQKKTFSFPVMENEGRWCCYFLLNLKAFLFLNGFRLLPLLSFVWESAKRWCPWKEKWVWEISWCLEGDKRVSFRTEGQEWRLAFITFNKNPNLSVIQSAQCRNFNFILKMYSYSNKRNRVIHPLF